jgi:hypothetical protein
LAGAISSSQGALTKIELHGPMNQEERQEGELLLIFRQLTYCFGEVN